jgi:Type III restriction enzyme, res subunit
VFRDATLSSGVLEANLGLEEFPTPAELWRRLCAYKGWSPEAQAITEQDYAPSKTPRYCQIAAINRTVEAIARGQRRILLVMATGTGKTYTAFDKSYEIYLSLRPVQGDPRRSGQGRVRLASAARHDRQAKKPADIRALWSVVSAGSVA